MMRGVVIQLVIVARDEPEVYEHLLGRFAGDPQVEVFVDRRRDRPDDPGLHDRRSAPSTLDDDLERNGVIIVPRRLAPPVDEVVRLREELAAAQSENEALRRDRNALTWQRDAMAERLEQFAEEARRPLDELRRKLDDSPPRH
ncbi:MAG: hypothetical protein ACREJG_14040 [Candidatus Rokuibacteriota bacterium]